MPHTKPDHHAVWQQHEESEDHHELTTLHKTVIYFSSFLFIIRKRKNQPRIEFLSFNFFDFRCMVIGSICAAIAGGTMPLYSFILGELLDSFNKPPDQMYDQIVKVAIYFLYLGAGAGITYLGRTSLWLITAERQIRRIREAYVRALLRQDIAWFDNVGTGELTTRISGDTILIQDGIGEKVGLIIQYLCMFICGMVMGFVRGWKLALVILAATPLLAFCGMIVMKVVVSLSAKGQKAYASGNVIGNHSKTTAAGNIAEEVLSAIRTVAAFGGEEREVERYSKNLDEAATVGVRKSALTGLGMGATFLCIFCTYALALWYGGKLVVHDPTYSGGRVINVLFSVIVGAFVLGQTAPNLESIGKARGAAYNIFLTIDRKPTVDSSSKLGEKPLEFQGNIELTNVYFHYPSRPNVDVFKGVSVSVTAGQKIALVGKSGCGKSSVVALLQRFYDPYQGDILLDGIDIKRLNVKWLRQQFGFVGQEPVLFSGTIADNISFGQINVTHAEIEAAAKSANAHNFIMDFPQGYETQVGERGAQLSGGQKQRIAIARAIIRNPKILLLDEATSALDSESEKVVQDALDTVMKGRTTIIIAHRLSTIRDADKIYVMDRGHVIESGNHDDLVALGGLYSELVMSQHNLHDVKKPKKQQHNNEDNAHTIKTSETLKTLDTASESTEKDMSNSEILKRLLILNKEEIPHLLFGCIGAVATGVIQPIFSVLFSHVINVYYKPKNQVEDDLRVWVLCFVALGVGACLCMFLQNYLLGYAGEKLTKKIRQRCFKAMLQQDIGWFDDKKNASGKLTSLLATDATQVQNLLGPRLAVMVSNFSVMGTAAGIAFYHNWKLTLVILATIPVMAFGNAMNMLAVKGFAQRSRAAVGEANQVATEAIQNIRTVVAFTNEERFYQMFSINLDEPTKMGLRTAGVSGVLVGIGQFVVFASFTLGYWYGGTLLRDGEITFLDMMRYHQSSLLTYCSVFMAIFMSAMAMGQNMALAPDSGTAKVAAMSIFRLIDMKSPVDPFSTSGKQLEGSKVHGDIALRSVQFSYPTRPDAKIFDSLTLQIPKGKVVALVGPSGCGKSSVVSLLERFYDPQHGSIEVDGENISSLNLKSWRSQIGLVGQEPVLFSGTIAENIAYGTSGATQEEIEAAAKSANAHNFIMDFPQGYETQVGEKGAQLSGGQKQRIAIARAIIRNPKILLLDEATSALDSESEKVVQDALDRVMKGRTTIIIAHRLSTIKDADVIHLIQKGKIEETGTHEELMRKGGLYYALVERQT